MINKYSVRRFKRKLRRIRSRLGSWGRWAVFLMALVVVPAGATAVTMKLVADRWNQQSLHDLVLRDQAGRVRMQLSINRAGNPSIVFLDEEGKATVQLVSDGKENYLSLGGCEKPTWEARATDDEAGIALFGNHSNPLARFSVVQDTPILAMWDQQNQPRLTMLTEDGKSQLITDN